MSNKIFNLDVNASYGLLPIVKEALRSEFDYGLNPSSIHQGGQRARAVIEDARASIKSFLGIGKDWKVIFTSGATEANNLAIYSSSLASTKNSPFHGITSAIEHHAVLEPFSLLSKKGGFVDFVSPENGKFLVDDFLKYVKHETQIVSLMYANNETGQVMPVRDLFAKVKEENPNISTHCDAVQAFGKTKIEVNSLNADMLTMSGHKIGALTGVGALIVKDDFNFKTLLLGGAQETRQRAGTENVLGIFSLGLACKYHQETLEKNIQKLVSLKEVFKTKLKLAFPDLNFNSYSNEELPNTINVRFPNILSSDLVVGLDLNNLYVSSGAACSSGKPLPSHVLLAMGCSEKEAQESIRISFRHDFQENDIDEVLSIIYKAIKK